MARDARNACQSSVPGVPAFLERIGTDIATVEFGWPVGMPVCRPLGGGIYECGQPLNIIASLASYSISMS